jgi:hypothetical protein
MQDVDAILKEINSLMIEQELLEDRIVELRKLLSDILQQDK